MLEVAFQPDRRGGEPLYRQLERFLRELVVTGRLASGEQLPPSRELARSLGLSRNTVNQAYESLVDAGLLRSHVGRGTFVRSGARAAAAPGSDAATPPFAWEGLLARRTRALLLPQGLVAEMAHPRIDFRAGRVDLGSLPEAELRRAYKRALSRLEALTEAVDPRGYALLRERLAQDLVARGIACDADEVAIVNGAQHGLDLVARTLVDPGDAVAMEQPGYFGAAASFSSCEAHLLGVGVDEDGLRTDELARLLRARRVKLLFCTPAVQSPTGVALSEARRRALLALADDYQLPIVEDDYDSELRYGGPPVPALKNLDRDGRVIYVGTFSKALFAGLRVGYVVAPRRLLRRLVISRWASDFASDVVTQAALTELITSGALERHVRRVRKLYAPRREALLHALAGLMPEGTSVTPPAGGSTVWVGLPEDVDVAGVHQAAGEAGIAYGRGEAFALSEGAAATDAARHLLLSFARISPQRMEPAVAALARVVRGAGISKKRRKAS